MSKEQRILAEHVSYRYDDDERLALEDISLSIEAGEFVAILGHNGSGKSTLAKLMNALYVPTEGKLLVCAINTAEDERVMDIRRRAGMIFQNPDNQIVASVVQEDVAFGLENLAVPHDEMLVRIEQALKAVNMSDFATSAPHMLSGGQKQRVGIAGVIAMEPDILIADEATSMLDPSGRAEVLETVRRLNREKGITVIWITHFMEEAAKADRVIIVNDHRVVRDGKPREIFEDVEKMREMHLDVPHMTDLADRLRRDGMPLPHGIMTVDEMKQEVLKLLCPSKSST